MQKFLNSIPKSKCARAQGVCTVEGPSCCDLLIGQQLPCTPSQQNWVKTSPCSATLNSGRPTHCLGPLDQVPGRPAVAIPLQPQMPQKQHLTWHREKGKGHELRQNNPEGGPEQTPPPRSSVSGESTVRHTRCRLICSRSKPRLGSPERRPYLTWAAAGLQEPRSRVSTGDTAPCCPGAPEGPPAGLASWSLDTPGSLSYQQDPDELQRDRLVWGGERVPTGLPPQKVLPCRTQIHPEHAVPHPAGPARCVVLSAAPLLPCSLPAPALSLSI